MLMSDYIEKCERLLREHGDHEVTDSEDESLGEPEFDPGGGDVRASFVLAQLA